MGHKPQGPDIFTLKKGYIECVSGSGSGKIYKVTHDSCSCKGFGFRKLCRHYRQAQTKGLLDKLEVQIKEYKRNNKVVNYYVQSMRIDAIKKFLDKNNIAYRISQVINIEKMLTQDTTKQEILGFFF